MLWFTVVQSGTTRQAELTDEAENPTRARTPGVSHGSAARNPELLAGLQLVLDRGPTADWFHAPEIWIEAIVAVIGLWIFVTHTLTAEQPFFDRRLAQDRNFITTTFASFFCGIPLVSTTALLPSLMQGLLGYPVLASGLMSMPRGIGTMISMVIFSKAPPGIDPRLAILCGMALTAIAMVQMMHFDLSMSIEPFIISGLLQGAGLGLTFVALTTTAFSTLAPNLRAEGSSLFSLVRGLGASIGVSVTQAMLVSDAATMHSSLAGHLDPSNPVVRADIGQRLDLTTATGLAGRAERRQSNEPPLPVESLEALRPGGAEVDAVLAVEAL